MFLKMRRTKQELSKDDAFKMLKSNSVGVLSLNGNDGYPYGVPLDYIVIGEDIYFHGASSGAKYSFIEKNDKASFCVIDKSEIDGNTYSNYYKSVICFGRVSIISDSIIKEKILKEIALSVNKDLDSNFQYIKKYFNVTTVFLFRIEHISAKVATEFTP